MSCWCGVSRVYSTAVQYIKQEWIATGGTGHLRTRYRNIPLQRRERIARSHFAFWRFLRIRDWDWRLLATLRPIGDRAVSLEMWTRLSRMVEMDSSPPPHAPRSANRVTARACRRLPWPVGADVHGRARSCARWDWARAARPRERASAPSCSWDWRGPQPARCSGAPSALTAVAANLRTYRYGTTLRSMSVSLRPTALRSMLLAVMSCSLWSRV